MMFARSFSRAFAGRAGFIGPMMAQAALTDGAAAVVVGHGLEVAGKLLIGPAGKTFRFVSPETAARWVDNARNIGIRERSLIASIDPAAAALWKARKREKLAVVAGRLIEAAARQVEPEKQAALILEAEYCQAKWV